MLILFGCGADSHVDYLGSGKEYMAKRDYAAAVIQLKNAVRTAPQEGEARYLLGSGLHELSDFSAAEIELRKAAAIGYAPESVRPALVRALIAQGELEKALAEADDSGIKDPAAKAELQALSGEALLGLGQVEKAHASFMQALSIDSANNTATLGLARVAGIRRDFTAAHAAVDAALLRAPTALPALLLKADLLAAEERVPEATAAYERVITVQPNDQRAHLGLVPLLLRQKDLSKARQRVDALMSAAPRVPSTLYLHALVSYSERKLTQASDAVQEVLKIAPNHTPSLLLAGAVAYDSGHYAQAEEHLRQVLAAIPRSAYAGACWWRPTCALVKPAARGRHSHRFLRTTRTMPSCCSWRVRSLLPTETYARLHDIFSAPQNAIPRTFPSAYV
jgi:putative PEP-CTERM system TPR-repeat lipoprotein